MIIEELKEKIQGKDIRILFSEGYEPKVIEAAVRLAQEGLLKPVLLSDPERVGSYCREAGLDGSGLEIIDPADYPDLDKLAMGMVVRRRGRLDMAQARQALMQSNYFGTMLVAEGVVDGMLGGLSRTTAETLRPVLQLVRTRAGESLASSVFILTRKDEQLFMADCVINRDPDPTDLVEIAMQTGRTVMKLGSQPKMALLSYSSFGSATGHCVAKMSEATIRLKRLPLEYPVDGEMQFDCAVEPEVAALKAPKSPVAGQANTFIFPNLSSGNIGYKIAARLGGFETLGPIIQGLNAPVNVLTREAGNSVDKIYQMAIVTAAQKVMGI